MIKNYNIEEKKIRDLLRTEFKEQYDKVNLFAIIKNIVTLVHQNINSNIDCKWILRFISQYLRWSGKEKKYYFNASRRVKNNGYVQLLYSIYDNSEAKDKYSKSKEEEDCDSDDSTMDTEEMKRIEEELDGNTCNNNYQTCPYKYPEDTKYSVVQQTDNKYGPFGTQWVHEIQKHDQLNDVLKKRAIHFDTLRAIKLPPQHSDGWFAMRKQRITASDGGTVLGLNKYEAQYKFILKKTTDWKFQSNRFCYHGTKFEQIATMIYEYRRNVKVEEFGLMAHPTISFIGASPDGIVNKFKLDGKHNTKYVGRMLEIKCPYSRKIRMEDTVKGDIVSGRSERSEPNVVRSPQNATRSKVGGFASWPKAMQCKQLNDTITENIQWIEDNDDLTKEEYDNKQKEIENIIRPILMSVYQNNDQESSNTDVSDVN